MDEREIARVARSAAESVYGVVEVVGSGWADRLTSRLGFGKTGVTVAREPTLGVTIDLRVADGVPQHQVATNVADKVRYAVQRDLGTTLQRLEIRVNGSRVETSQAESSQERSGG